MSNNSNLSALAAALDDGTSGQVLQSTGSGGVQFADSTGSGVTVHANQAAMLTDAASADEGTLHYETDNNKLYVKQSSGFYLLASITNVSPTIDSYSENTGGAGANNLSSGGSFTLTAGSNTVITINASDANLDTLTYSATVTSGTATNVISSPSFPVTNQSSNVFTLTPASATGGTVTIRFDVSDGTNVSNVSHSFSIEFLSYDYTSPSYSTMYYHSSPSAQDRVGQVIDIDDDGNTLVVGAFQTNTYTGEIYVFQRTNSANTWSQQKQFIPTDVGQNDYFGQCTRISGDGNYIVAGSHRDDDTQTDSGAIYIFYRGTGDWSGGTQQAKKKASVIESSANFGYAVDIDEDGDTLVATALLENLSGTSQGAAYVFTRSGSTWTQQAKLTASDSEDYLFFGGGCSITGDGNTIAISTRSGKDNNGVKTGAVYIFTRSGTTWSQQVKLYPSHGTTGTDFGNEGSCAISKDGNYVICGARYTTIGGDFARGSAHIFYKGATSWSSTGTYQAEVNDANGSGSNWFGQAVCLNRGGEVATVGAWNTSAGGSQTGSVYVFERSGTSWSEHAELYDATSAQIGYSVAISSDTQYLAGGAPSHSGSGQSYAGGFKVWKTG